jgi:hypothetical protein
VSIGDAHPDSVCALPAVFEADQHALGSRVSCPCSLKAQHEAPQQRPAWELCHRNVPPTAEARPCIKQAACACWCTPAPLLSSFSSAPPPPSLERTLSCNCFQQLDHFQDTEPHPSPRAGCRNSRSSTKTVGGSVTTATARILRRPVLRKHSCSSTH